MPLPQWAMDGYGWPWVAPGEPVLAPSAGHPNCGNYIYIYFSNISVMGRAGHSMNLHMVIADDKGHHQMQQVTLITLIVNMQARTYRRPENMHLQD